MAEKTSGRSRSRSGKRYGPKAGKKVERAMHEMKRGQLKSGRSGKTVKSRKQAIAIGLSEARRAGGKVPRRRSSSSSSSNRRKKSVRPRRPARAASTCATLGPVKPSTEQELSAIGAEAKRLGAVVPALVEILGQSLPRLVEDVRAAQRELAVLRGELEKEKADREKSSSAPAGRPARLTGELRDEAAEAASALLAAPFRVSARAAASARTDPLAALAIQVAKALSPDASALERARLIAMAFAASQGDLEAFWAARRQRKAPPATRSTPLRGK
jgi:hypothetical protein